MADENNTAVAAAPAEGNQGAAPVSQGQEGTEPTSAAAPEEGNQGGRKYLNKYDTPEELETAAKAAFAELTRMKQAAKASPAQVKQDLLGSPQQAEGAQAAAQQMTQTQGAAMAQQAGGDPLEAAYTDLVQRHGVARANYMMLQYLDKQRDHRTQELVQQYVAPAQQRVFESELTVAWTALATEHGFDPADKAVTKQVNEFLAARPNWKRQLEGAASREEMYEVLDYAFSRVREETAATASKVAAESGAKREQARQQQAASAAAESGRAATDMGKTGKASLADDWLAAMMEHDKGTRLFDK